MAKAVTALTLGKNYTQDQALRWGFLTVPEESHQAKMKRKRAGRGKAVAMNHRRPEAEPVQPLVEELTPAPDPWEVCLGFPVCLICCFWTAPTPTPTWAAIPS